MNFLKVAMETRMNVQNIDDFHKKEVRPVFLSYDLSLKK